MGTQTASFDWRQQCGRRYSQPDSLLKRAKQHWRELWTDYLDEVWGFGISPHDRPKHRDEPWAWFANRVPAKGRPDGCHGRIGNREFSAEWCIPPRFQGLAFIKRDGWRPE